MGGAREKYDYEYDCEYDSRARFTITSTICEHDYEHDLRAERRAPSPAVHKELSLVFNLPYLPLASLPTPVSAHPGAAADYGLAGLFVKHDEQTRPYYGGNKVRKLGFLLAHAKANAFPAVLTFGGAGSNHALATAVYARELGMRALLVLGPQHNSRHVRANLLCALAAQAALYPCDWKDTATVTAQAVHDAWHADGRAPFIIPPGGSSPLGTVGYVNAAFELRQQIAEGALPEPDAVYVASGTMGTCVGLALGMLAAGLKTQVVAVRVTKAPYTSLERAQALFTATHTLLANHDPDFPRIDWRQASFAVRDEFYGEEYALFTPAGMKAVSEAQEALDLQLEGTYTGKAFAGLLADAASGALTGKNVLFWNTYAGDDTPLYADAAGQDWHNLPVPLQHYFTQPLQPLERGQGDEHDSGLSR